MTFDFSTLGKPSQPEPIANQVPSLIAEIDQNNLRGFLKLSEQIPCLVDVYTSRTDSSASLSAKLQAETIKRGGAFLLLRLDSDRYPEFLQAFQITGVPAVTALLKGQSIPLFTSDQTAEAIEQVVDRMLAVAKENGIVGTVQADEAGEVEPVLPPKHLAAVELVEQGEYEKAIAAYREILNEAPADELAAAGMAQASLLLRTQAIDFDKVMQSSAKTVAEAIDKSDALVTYGRYAEGFDAILDFFETADQKDRDALRAHLLELFKVVPSDEPALARARVRLANLLF
ncbi:MAG: tetratricopeptide repeat protein [Micrococcales bacterium]